MKANSEGAVNRVQKWMKEVSGILSKQADGKSSSIRMSDNKDTCLSIYLQLQNEQCLLI